MRRPLALGLLAATAVLAVLAVAVVSRSDDQAPVPSGAPDSLAADACARLRLVEQGVRADAAGADVLEEVARARAAARAAAEQDPRWVALAGGTAALDEALRTDDAGAAAVAVRVTRAECGQDR